MFETLEPRHHLATLPAGFSEDIIATGLAEPTAMAFAPDGRLFIAEQDGALRVVKNNQLLETPFVDLNVDSWIERGLLGIAFHPKFHRKPYVYLYYTVPGDENTPAHRILLPQPPHLRQTLCRRLLLRRPRQRLDPPIRPAHPTSRPLRLRHRRPRRPRSKQRRRHPLVPRPRLRRRYRTCRPRPSRLTSPERLNERPGNLFPGFLRVRD